MVYHLSLFGRQVEITMHLIIVERADAGRPQPERFRGEIQAVADGARFEKHIAITPGAKGADGTGQNADHRERKPGITRASLAQTQTPGRDPLVPTPGLLPTGTHL